MEKSSSPVALLKNGRSQCLHNPSAPTVIVPATIICLGSGYLLLGICFWRKVREEGIWAEYMGEKGGCLVR